MSLSWMAWTWPTAIFFGCIVLMLLGMIIWESVSPSTTRIGILGIATTRGDRLFVSLLGSAFIQLGWIAIVGEGLLWPAVLCMTFVLCIFRWF